MMHYAQDKIEELQVKGNVTRHFYNSGSGGWVVQYCPIAEYIKATFGWKDEEEQSD
jgi:hypothetical protein